ncbi:hypothetical protein M9H77_08576 [Catharanthus roseus]|uniref:Uncharacterized protein n=1 Tax=Catharanthus roseus TaxID=4058 RepID=A0ACC0BY65_CATRO|nr:hypothetical protein M9H77_08576 [Catharanthus roseus]
MKKQRSTTNPKSPPPTTRAKTTTTTKKKPKSSGCSRKVKAEIAAPASAEDVKFEEDQKIRNDEREFVKAEELGIAEWEDFEWPQLFLNGGFDEQMSWGTCWFPPWDMEFIDDVVWEDDIWDLKQIKNVPSSPLPLPSPP